MVVVLIVEQLEPDYLGFSPGLATQPAGQPQISNLRFLFLFPHLPKGTIIVLTSQDYGED